MMKCSDLIKILNRQADESYACDWDNVGPVSYTHLIAWRIHHVAYVENL